MSVRVVARVRPLWKTELEKDIIVRTSAGITEADKDKGIVKIPNPKNEAELYSFQFNSVYDQSATQSDVFDKEVAPTVKHLFKGFDVTLFAYGVTGTGKTHTMRGGKSLTDRGMIPRLLSSVYRQARKTTKDSEGSVQVEVVMSYYEIYNDKVYDLFEPPEKRTAAGLPIRDNNGKSVVVGLTERPCTTLKEFEKLYDEANVNRSTSATKLNTHSSRSHAILCVKVTQTNGTQVRVSTASAIDLAGSEDNRRTDNNKDRLVESASINKSLFVLAQCVEAISKKQSRIPYRESKMTRILSLGQNNGLTIMILNLAPLRSYHLDTLSSLNFANRTKKIDVNEIENQPFYRDIPTKTKLDDGNALSKAAAPLFRQPLRPKILSQDSQLRVAKSNAAKPAKEFAVYTDKPSQLARPLNIANSSQTRAHTPPLKSPKRTSSEAFPSFSRPAKAIRSGNPSSENSLSKEAIEALIERKVCQALADRADQTVTTTTEPLSGDVQKRLEMLEKRIEGQESERAEGLQYLLMAKQHQVRGEDGSALTMYRLALPHFPGNEKLVRKVAALQEKLAMRRFEKMSPAKRPGTSRQAQSDRAVSRRRAKTYIDESYCEGQHDDDSSRDDDDEEVYRPKSKARPLHTPRSQRAFSIQIDAHNTPNVESNRRYQHADDEDSEHELASALTSQTPRTKQVLDIINTKDVSKIRLLRGVGAKKAEAIVNCLCDLDDDERVTTLAQLGKLKGVGAKTVESMRNGLVV